MLTWRRLGLALALAALATRTGTAEEAARPRIDSLTAEVHGSEIALKFRLSGVLNPELATRIQAGLETAIAYDIRLYRHNAHWFWDNRMGTRRYRVAVTYEPVTREYVIVETMDGRPYSRSTMRDFPEVAQRLVSNENLRAFRVREDGLTNLYVEMRATFDAGYLFTIIPVDSQTNWARSNRFEVRAAAR
jgi:uncharacterized protein DUF4390